MRRVLLIFLSLVLALVGGSAAYAEDGFYVIPAMKGNYAPVPKTGQTTPSDTGTDGALRKGVAWPTPRFTDNGNGNVSGNLTGLIWLKNANAFGMKTWADAMTTANGLKSGDVGTGLTDGSQAGDWRLPNVRELQSLLDYGRSYPALPENHPFTELVWGSYYWSSTTFSADPNIDAAFDVAIGGNTIADPYNKTNADDYVWCVRGGR
jgi:hypothetical protein